MCRMVWCGRTWSPTGVHTRHVSCGVNWFVRCNFPSASSPLCRQGFTVINTQNGEKKKRSKGAERFRELHTRSVVTSSNCEFPEHTPSNKHSIHVGIRATKPTKLFCYASHGGTKQPAEVNIVSGFRTFTVVDRKRCHKGHNFVRKIMRCTNEYEWQCLVAQGKFPCHMPPNWWSNLCSSELIFQLFHCVSTDPCVTTALINATHLHLPNSSRNCK